MPDYNKYDIQITENILGKCNYYRRNHYHVISNALNTKTDRFLKVDINFSV